MSRSSCTRPSTLRSLYSWVPYALLLNWVSFMRTLLLRMRPHWWNWAVMLSACREGGWGWGWGAEQRAGGGGVDGG
jgi:hypothetical protein